ncbi:hypothetical protein [Selenomonas sputigena]|uniref:hypothetical protein n=1 Tax=Selenomonas sputigena TaxID=69823 RepID=UPI0028E1EAD1|nr:hypothetical protein [Selenomonas sputigena]
MVNYEFEMRRAAFVDTQRRVLEDARLSPYSCAVTETILNSVNDDYEEDDTNVMPVLIRKEYRFSMILWHW